MNEKLELSFIERLYTRAVSLQDFNSVSTSLNSSINALKSKLSTHIDHNKALNSKIANLELLRQEDAKHITKLTEQLKENDSNTDVLEKKLHDAEVDNTTLRNKLKTITATTVPVTETARPEEDIPTNAPKKHSKRKVVSKTVVKSIFTDSKKGLKAAVIAKKYNISTSTVYRVLRGEAHSKYGFLKKKK